MPGSKAVPFMRLRHFLDAWTSIAASPQAAYRPGLPPVDEQLGCCDVVSPASARAMVPRQP